MRLVPGYRSEPYGGVFQHLDQNSAEADHDRRAVAIVAHDSGEKLDAARSRHRLDRYALELCAGRLRGEILLDPRKRRPHFVGGIQTQLDAADLAFVAHVRREHLEHGRKTPPRRDRGGLVGGSGGNGNRDVDSEPGDYPFGFDFRKCGTPRARGVRDNLRYCGVTHNRRV